MCIGFYMKIHSNIHTYKRQTYIRTYMYIWTDRQTDRVYSSNLIRVYLINSFFCCGDKFLKSTFYKFFDIVYSIAYQEVIGTSDINFFHLVTLSFVVFLFLSRCYTTSSLCRCESTGEARSNLQSPYHAWLYSHGFVKNSGKCHLKLKTVMYT